MQKFTASVFINRSQQDVFSFLSNPANNQKWMPLMQSAGWTSSGEPGVGSTGRGIMKMAGKEMELLFLVTRWDAPNRYGIKILNVPFPFKFTEYVYRLEPEDGGTRVTLDGEFEMVSILRFVAGSMGKIYAKSNGNERKRTQHLKAADGSGLTKRALDAGDSSPFSSIFLASSFFCGAKAQSTPAPVPVTRTVSPLNILRIQL